MDSGHSGTPGTPTINAIRRADDPKLSALTDGCRANPKVTTINAIRGADDPKLSAYLPSMQPGGQTTLNCRP
eukprot:8762568-Karenia_brevis.AAC.1